MVSVFAVRTRNGQSAEWLEQGVNVVGDHAQSGPNPGGRNYDVLAFWSARRTNYFNIQKQRGKRALVMERAYLGDRYKWISLGYDGLNGHADFCNGNVDDDRAQVWLPDLKDWKHGGDYALVVGQVPNDMSLGGKNIDQWLNVALVEAVKKYGSVIYRPHPLAKNRSHPTIPNGVMIDKQKDLNDTFKKAIVCITYSSNCGVNAVMQGIPVVAHTPCSMVWDIATHSIDAPLKTPCRRDWLRRMAYTQWLPHEIQNGDAWRHLKKGVK